MRGGVFLPAPDVHQCGAGPQRGEFLCRDRAERVLARHGVSGVLVSGFGTEFVHVQVLHGLDDFLQAGGVERSGLGEELVDRVGSIRESELAMMRSGRAREQRAIWAKSNNQ